MGTLLDEIHRRALEGGMDAIDEMIKALYIAENVVMKDGIVLGKQIGAVIDGERVQPPDGYPFGFMVVNETHAYHSSWDTAEAAKEKAARLNIGDELHHYTVCVV